MAHHAEVLAGMAAAAGAAACFDGAVLLQARDARAVEAEHALRISLLTRLLRRPLWVAGTLLGTLGWPLQLAAFALAPVTVVQPTLAVGMLLLLGAGSRVLGERVGPREWAAAVAVIAGVALLAVGSPEHTERLPSAGAAAVTTAVLAAAMALPFLGGRRRGGPWVLVVAAGCGFALTGLTSKLLTVELAAGRIWAVLAFAAATGVAAGVAFLVDMTALQRFDATRVAPPMFVLETAIPVALAPVLFGERWSATPGGGLVVLAGLVLVLAGGGVLGASRPVAVGGGELEDDVGGGGERPVGGVGTPR